MNTVDIIIKKREGMTLLPEEIRYMVMGYTNEEIPDYQMSSFLMAVCLKGMTKEETVSLTRIMRDSGDVMDLSAIKGIKVDKHSTGGVGDKTTLIVAPVAAACGVPIAKMSGRGLGFTGGTIDKLESIPGFRTSMERNEFVESVNRTGIAVIGQTGRIAPADKKIYALRDVTGTTESISLITSSIMSKKLAAGSDAIVLDVKCGRGAFMKNYERAEELARWMVDIGKSAGKKMKAVISDMDQPLGKAVGNALEVQEAIDVLKGEGPEDIFELSVELAGAMIGLGGKAACHEEARDMARQAIDSGRALDRFREFVKNQGGDTGITDDYSIMAESRYRIEVSAPEEGYVSELDAMTVGIASRLAGAGREKKGDLIDMSAGIILNKKRGDFAQKGETICTVCGMDREKVERGAGEVLKAYSFKKERIPEQKLIRGVIE